MRYILTLAILLLGVTGFAQDKTGALGEGKTYLDISFDASDTINESQTYYVEIENFQHYPQMQDFYVDIDSVSGTPGVTIKAYGKKFSGDSYVQIGDSVVWAGTADTTFVISATTANRYRYLKVEFVADATDQQSLVSDVIVKTWMSGGDLSTSALTLTGNLSVGGTTTLTGATTANGSITLGAGDDLIGSSTSDITINTDKFTVAGATGNTVVAGTLAVTGASTFTGLVTANGGVTLGAGDDLIGSSTSDITINTDKFTVAGATGNTVIAGTLGVTGATTATGLITANGGVTLGADDDLIGSATSDITFNTNKFTVAGASGNTVVGGTLSVANPITASQGVVASDSLKIDAFKFVVASDTLCVVSGSDTLRIFPVRE